MPDAAPGSAGAAGRRGDRGPKDPTLALWALNLARPWAGPEAFVAAVEAKLGEAAARGADLLLLPEHVAEAWLTFAPPALPEAAEVAWMAATAAAVLPELGRAARRAGVGLLAGTAPAASGAARWRNRATLFLPDGRTVVQDKLVLTPDERDPGAWMLEPGDRLTLVTWRGWRLAILVCLDVEQPALAARLQAADLDLVLVPSDTASAAGHARVFGCARARAVELFCAVAAVGGSGTIPRPPARPNVSGAAVYVPCEPTLGSHGVLADTGPLEPDDGAGPLVVVGDVPLGAIRALRRSGAEVWPGAWDAGDVRIEAASG
jgi:predicted amidohydrolase